LGLNKHLKELQESGTTARRRRGIEIWKHKRSQGVQWVHLRPRA